MTNTTVTTQADKTFLSRAELAAWLDAVYTAPFGGLTPSEQDVLRSRRGRYPLVLQAANLMPEPVAQTDAELYGRAVARAAVHAGFLDSASIFSLRWFCFGVARWAAGAIADAKSDAQRARRVAELNDLALTLPMPAEDIADLEDAGHIVDLVTGDVLYNGASWRYALGARLAMSA